MNKYILWLVALVPMLFSSCEWFVEPETEEDGIENGNGNTGGDSNSEPTEVEYAYSGPTDMISCHDNLDFKIYAIGMWSDNTVAVKFTVSNIGNKDITLNCRADFAFDDLGNQYFGSSYGNNGMTVVFGNANSGTTNITVAAGVKTIGCIYLGDVPSGAASLQYLSVKSYVSGQNAAFSFRNVKLPGRTPSVANRPLQGIEIEPFNDDVKIEVINCFRTLKGEIGIDFNITNKSSSLMYYSASTSYSSAYDEDGNMGKMESVTLGSYESDGGSNNQNLPGKVFTRATLRISDIPPSSEMLTYVSVSFYSLGRYTNMVFKNLPIRK